NPSGTASPTRSWRAENVGTALAGAFPKFVSTRQSDTTRTMWPEQFTSGVKQAAVGRTGARKRKVLADRAGASRGNGWKTLWPSSNWWIKMARSKDNEVEATVGRGTNRCRPVR